MDFLDHLGLSYDANGFWGGRFVGKRMNIVWCRWIDRLAVQF